MGPAHTPPPRNTTLHQIWLFLLRNPEGTRLADLARHLRLTGADMNKLRANLNVLRHRALAKAIGTGIWQGINPDR